MTLLAPTVSYAGASIWTDAITANSIANVSWGTGDTIYVGGATEGANTINLPTATGLTFTQIVTIGDGSSCHGYWWKATAAAPGTNVTITANTSSASMAGVLAYVVSAGSSAGTGNTGGSITGTTTTANVVRAGNNSAVLWVGGDFGATNDVVVASVPVGGTQRQAAWATGRATLFAFDWPDEGAAGTTAYGISGFAAGGVFMRLGVEVLGVTVLDVPDVQMAPMAAP